MLLIRNGQVYSPKFLGQCDILIGGGKIVAMAESLSRIALPGTVETIDARGMVLTPGFIDGHQHFIGGGGEGGFHTRTPEMTLSMNTTNGVTTAVGLLGTDSLTRSVESLYAKTQAFNSEGITAFMLTGSYWHPSPTITRDVSNDLIYIAPVIGVKLALADIRGPHMTIDRLATLAADVRVAALVGNKPGIITIHLGIKPERLNLVLQAVHDLGIRADTFIPTHINRKDQSLKEQIFELGTMGGFFDATCTTIVPDEKSSAVSAACFAMEAREKGLFQRLLFSSDAGGSLPKWNKDHSRILGMGIGSPDSLLAELKRLVHDFSLPLEEALMPLTITPATAYGLMGQKGTLRVGADADILIMHPETFSMRDVLAKGKIMVQNESVVTSGYFE